MTATVIFAARARRALMGIGVYIAQDDEAAAYRLIADIEKRVLDTLSMFPEAGAKSQADRRTLTVRRHTVVYRYEAVSGMVFVLDAFGPGMDWR